MNDESRNRGVMSVEISVQLLTALARHPGPMPLSHLASAVGMPAAKVHRYLASFVETGMVNHRHSGTYDLGARAAEIGIAALSRIDPINAAADGLDSLVDATGATASLSVWGSHGPTIVRWERAAIPLVTTLGLGSVLPLTRSATGQVCMAYLPDRLLRDAIASEWPEGDLSALSERRTRTRIDGFAIADQDFIPGLYAVAAPVLSLHGDLEAVVTLISSDRGLIQAEAPERRALLQFVRDAAGKRP